MREWGVLVNKRKFFFFLLFFFPPLIFHLKVTLSHTGFPVSGSELVEETVGTPIKLSAKT